MVVDFTERMSNLYNSTGLVDEYEI